ncbi:MAG: NADH-quinone oxidoreductase subunit M [Cytophagales bacterium]|nr:MAG: NADH-quinone oxidoreductase subunit M [Cytophagales bacterium]
METALLIALPLLSGLLTFLFQENKAKQISFLISIATFINALYLAFNYCSCTLFNYDLNLNWINSLGIHFHVAVDGISLILILLTTLLVPLILLSTFQSPIKNAKSFYFLILAMESALIGVFTARDAFLFYIFWELALIPIYFICLIWGGENKNKITFKFFLYTLAGSLFMLLAIIILYLNNPARTFEIEQLYQVGRTLDFGTQAIIFWSLFLAFAIKMPIFPFHTWQPDTYTTAPFAGTMLLSGIMLKMGIYGVIRWLYPMVPLAFDFYAHYAIILSVIGIIYASIIALMQKNLKRMIAYVSIAHVGLISAGVFVGNEEALQGAIIQMFMHGINVVGLFFVIQLIFERTNALDMTSLGGIRAKAPLFTLFFIIILLSSVAVPLTGGFVGEFLLFVGIFQYHEIIAAVSGLTIVFGAAYMLNSFQKVMLGEANEKTENFKPLHLTEKMLLIPIVALIIIIGVYPKPFLKISEPAVKALIEIANSTIPLNH